MAVGVQVPPSAPSKKGHLRFAGVVARLSRSFTCGRSQAWSLMTLTNMTFIRGEVVPLTTDRPLINTLSFTHVS